MTGNTFRGARREDLEVIVVVLRGLFFFGLRIGL
jgi:hypothetical protein